MSSHRSTFPILPAVLLAVLLTLLPRPAQALTESDWMITLVDSLGRSFGLPDEPTSADYLNILQGKRNLRFEAEDVRSGNERVSTLAFKNFGPFSGSGWLLGTSQPSRVQLHFVLPLGGRYRLSMTVGRPGHSVQVGNQHFMADGDERSFTEVALGELDLLAGPQEFIIILPPGGAIDCFDLAAANLPAIVPQGGWRPEAPLTWETLLLTTLQALALGKELPHAERSLAIEAETLGETGGAQVVEDAHLGQPSAGRWLRAIGQPAVVTVPLNLPQGGFYDLELTALGENLEIMVADHLPLNVAGHPYLAAVALPPVFLPKGKSSLQITLPPGGGFDRIVLTARRTDVPAMAAVLGMAVTGSAPAPADLDRLTALLAAAAR